MPSSMASLPRSTRCCSVPASFFFFNDPATTEIYTLSLHDALPICGSMPGYIWNFVMCFIMGLGVGGRSEEHTSELQSHVKLVCRLLLEKKKVVVEIELGAGGAHEVREFWDRRLSYAWPGNVSWRSETFFFNVTATTEIYTLSLHDALPI